VNYLELYNPALRRPSCPGWIVPFKAASPCARATKEYGTKYLEKIVSLEVIERVCEYLLVHERKDFLGARSVSPIPHEIHGDGEHTHQSDTGTLHATVGIESELVIESTGSISVGENGVASFD
jgi:hypothetical protein